MTWTIWVVLSGLLSASGIGLGAFGAHLLRDQLSQRMLEVFETGVRYQMYHAIALLVIGLLATKVENIWLTLAASGMLGGTLLFSGSLYAIAVFDLKYLGVITPIGGVILILAWLLLVVATLVQ